MIYGYELEVEECEQGFLLTVHDHTSDDPDAGTTKYAFTNFNALCNAVPRISSQLASKLMSKAQRAQEGEKGEER